MNRRIKLYISAILLIIASINAEANISTKIVNSDNIPICGATVSLIELSDSTLISISVSDSEGIVKFNEYADVSKGLNIIMTGYIPQAVNTSELPNCITMYPSNTELEELTVIGTSVVKYDKGVISYIPKGVDLNVGNSFEVLQFAPMITFKDDEIYMLGNGNTPVSNILINSRKSLWNRATIIQYLKSIVPEDIIKIEIFPNAQYEYGVGGSTVNFILKNRGDGLLGGAEAYAKYENKRFSERVELLLAYQKNNFSASANFRFSNRMNYSKNSSIENFYNYCTSVNSFQKFNSRATSLSGNINLQYALTYRSTLSASFLIEDEYRKESERHNNEYYTSNNLDSISTSLHTDVNKLGHPDWTIAAQYLYNIDAKGSFFRASAYYGRHGMRDPHDNLNYSIYTPQNELLKREEYNQITQSTGYTTGVYAQYQQRLSNKFSLISLYQFVYNRYDTQNGREYLDVNSYIQDPKFDDIFLYTERFHRLAFLGIYSITNYLGVSAMLSMDFTGITFNQTTLESGKFKQNYIDLLPQIQIFASTSNRLHSFQLMYSQKTIKPLLHSINPAVKWHSPSSATVGNPNLKRSIYHSAKLYYNFLQDYSLSLGASWRPNEFGPVPLEIDDSKTITTYDNIGNSSIYTIVAEMNKSFFGGTWRFKPTVEGNYYYNKGKGAFSNYNSDGFTWNIAVDNTVYFSMKHKFYATLHASYNSGMITIRQSMKGSFFMSMSVNKSFNFGGNLRLQLSPITKLRNIRYLNTSTYSYYNKEYNSYIPGISITYRQSFGNSRVKEAKDLTNSVERRF